MILKWRQPVEFQTQWVAQTSDLQPRAAIIGPRGPAGPPGSVEILENPTGEAVGGNLAVKVAADGLAYLASPGDPDLTSIVGISMNSAIAGDNVRIQNSGVLEESGWNWTPGPVYLGNNGTLTQLVPTEDAIVRMGTALNSTTLIVEVVLVARL